MCVINTWFCRRCQYPCDRLIDVCFGARQINPNQPRQHRHIGRDLPPFNPPKGCERFKGVSAWSDQDCSGCASQDSTPFHLPPSTWSRPDYVVHGRPQFSRQPQPRPTPHNMRQGTSENPGWLEWLVCRTTRFGSGCWRAFMAVWGSVARSHLMNLILMRGFRGVVARP